MPELTRPQKITFGDMRKSDVDRILIYCADHKCSHSIEMNQPNLARLLARRPEGIFISDFEQGEIGPDLFRKAPAHPAMTRAMEAKAKGR